MQKEILGNESLKNIDLAEHSNGSSNGNGHSEEPQTFVTDESLVLIDLENTAKDKVIEELVEGEDGVSFNQLDKEGVLKKFSQMLNENRITELMSQMNLIKEAYRKFQEAPKSVAEEQEPVAAENGEEKKIEKPAPVEDNRFKTLLAQYKLKKDEFLLHQREEKDHSFAIKQGLIEELKKLNAQEEQIGKAFQRFREIQDKWRTSGRVAEDKYKEIQGEYHYQIEVFYYNMKINKELKELDLQKNLIQKLEIVNHIQNLQKEDSIKKTDFFLRKHLEEWSNLGPVPYDKKEEIRIAFNEATTSIIQKIRTFYQKLHEEQNQNLELKTALCLQAEQLSMVEYDSAKTWQESTDQLMKLREEWKTIGFAPKSANTKIWQRFNKAFNDFFGKKREFYNKLKDQQKSVRADKIAIIQKAEELAASTDWTTATEELKKLQLQWRNIGNAGKEEFKLWKKFRDYCDKFFEAKKAHFSSQIEDQTKNLDLKKGLVQRISEYSPNGDKEAALQILRGFSEEWDNIGHVPFKEKDKIYNDYKKALDDKYKAMKIEQAERSEMMFKAKVERLKDGGDAKRILSKESRFIKEQIDKLLTTISAYENNLGFFGKTNSNKANPMKAEVEKKLAKTREELDALQTKMRLLRSSVNS